MSVLWKLTCRNQSLFYRNKGNIFFSVMSVLILLVLHFLMLQTMFIDQWTVMADMFQIEVKTEDIQWLVDTLMFAGIIPIAAISISLVTLGVVVADRESKSLNDFLVTPLKRNTLFFSYLISSFIIGFTILSAFVILYEIYFLVLYGFGFSLVQVGYIFLVVILCLIFANTFMLVIVMCLKTQQARSSIGTILGTSLGFITGAYVPLNQFGETIANICNLLPFSQITVLAKQVFLMNLSSTDLPEILVTEEIGKNFGVELWVYDNLLEIPQILMILAAFVVLFIVILIRQYAKLKADE